VNTTPRFPRRFVVAITSGVALTGLLIGGVVPANAAVPTVPTVGQTVQGINQPLSNTNASKAVNEYTFVLGRHLLTGGPDFVPAPNGVVLDTNAYALASSLQGGYVRSVGDAIQRVNGVLVAPVNNGDQTKTVMVNSTENIVTLQDPQTGQYVVIAPNSAMIVDGYLLKGAIKSKYWALGGSDVVGFATGAEINGTNGRHAGATLVASQQFSINGSISEIQWTSAHGAHHIKGAIYGLYTNSGGKNHNGAVKSDEYQLTVSGKKYTYLDAERARFRYDPATRQTVRLAFNAR